ncbi:DUF2147 domain-containing protein [Dyella japonica]|uniref:DUF2147 domain-containing protein n=1 Tax=Dyella japonica TaxID=231455 RepID=UPI000364AD9A|nr:DUF2147 domain-containing protein [Dyella japonica]
MRFVNAYLSSGWRRWVGLALLWVGCCGVAFAQTPQDDGTPASAIEGDWLVASRDAIIRIEAQGDTFIGTIVWQLHDTYGPEDGPELNGKIVTDRHNPDPALRSRPLTGLRLLWGLHYDADAQAWVDGFVYNADNGKQYHCEVHVPAPDRLVLRGYIGIPLLGGSTTWTRTHEPFPAAATRVHPVQ